ncbi:MAG: class I SAM-dependent methyltransferase [Pseudomonadota bacterium]
MGVDCVNFQRLVELSARPDYAPGRGLMLGRQGFRVRARLERFYRRWLSMYERGVSIEDLVADDGYSEKLFKKIGIGDVESMDFSEYEGAQHLQDLNQSVSQELHDKFDFIFDGGTIEHVFDIPAALRNVFHMLKDGGVFASTNGLNGWLFHGMYQFNPEMVYAFWKNMAGCEVLRCLAVSENPRIRPIALPDMSASGRRLRVPDFPEGRVYLYYEVRKTPGAKLSGSALQSDYQAQWARSDAASKSAEAS